MRNDTIVVIDDDDVILELSKKILRDYKVITYSEIDIAYKDRIFTECDLVVLDVQLKELCGIDYLRDIKSKNENLPVILITGSNDIELAVKAISLGADDFVLKPFSFERLKQSVEKVLKNKHLNDQNKTLLKELTEKNKRLEELNAQTLIRSSKLNNDLDMASNLQDCLYPKELPSIPGMKLASRSISVEKISGDFYYFDVQSDTKFSFIFADVSGHGVTAALFSAMVKVAITSINFTSFSPSEVVKKINDFLIDAQKKPSYNYLTLCYCDIDLKKREINYCNAGLPYPLLLKNNSDKELLTTTGPFVGIFTIAEFQDSVIKYEKGEKLIFFTDGAYEDIEDYDLKKGYENIVNIIDKNHDRDVLTIIGNMYEKINEKAKSDDATCLGFEFTD